MLKRILWSLLLGMVFFLSGCTEVTTTDKLMVVVSIVPEFAMVEAVGGEYVQIVTIIPPGYSPESYDPSAKTMQDIQNASVYFTIGVPAESGTILPAIDGMRIVSLNEAAAAVYPERMFSETSRDPHVWLSLRRVVVMVQTIADTLAEIDPEHADSYQANALQYNDQLEQADLVITGMFSNLTMSTFLVFHPSYGYFADDYGLTMVALEEEGKEATSSHLQDVIDLARDLEIGTIFYQAEIDSSQVRAFAEEINAEMVELDPLAQDYLGNIQQMASAIREALR